MHFKYLSCWIRENNVIDLYWLIFFDLIVSTLFSSLPVGTGYQWEAANCVLGKSRAPLLIPPLCILPLLLLLLLLLFINFIYFIYAVICCALQVIQVFFPPPPLLPPPPLDVSNYRLWHIDRFCNVALLLFIINNKLLIYFLYFMVLYLQVYLLSVVAWIKKKPMDVKMYVKKPMVPSIF